MRTEIISAENYDNDIHQVLERFTRVFPVSHPESNDIPAQTTISLTPSSHESARLERLGFARHYRFAVVPSPHAPRWLFPLPVDRTTTESLKLYAAYRLRARILRALLLGVIKTRWNGWARHKILISSRKPLALEALVGEVTGEERPVFAMSLGTKGKYRKLTLQVMRPDGEILGYIKLPLSEWAGQRLGHEAAVLKQLASSPVMRSIVPKLLFSEVWGTSRILFQSAGPPDPGPLQFEDAYSDFLQKLGSLGSLKPARPILDEVATRWQKTESSLNLGWKQLGQSVLRQACRDLANASVLCGLTHGDFAPWNCRLGKGHLFVFDWESAKWNAPLLWDVFHFRVQVAGLLKKGGCLMSLPKRSVERASFLLYLLDSICQTIEEHCPSSQDFLDYKRSLLIREVARD